MTDTKGDRAKRILEGDPDMYVHVVQRRKDGIVVRGAKLHQSGAFAAHQTVVIPGGALRKGEEDYAVAFAVPNSAPGITYILQYNPLSAEREQAEDLFHLGNPQFGQRETCLMVFDDVFVPYENVFMCGEVEFAGPLIQRFAKTHRMNCGGACKVGFADIIIGAAQHITGCLNSKWIVAINKDPDANIFKISNLGLMADYRVALPVLIEKLKTLLR